MIADAAGHKAVVTVEDGFVDGGAGSAMRTAVAAAAFDAGHAAPTTSMLGVPCTFLPHGKPEDILASLGLDAGGVVAAAQRALTID
jgi:1-deoxy-D-xylulose-5-phosphate synthase